LAAPAYAQQAGLLAARAYYDKGNIDASRAALTWVAEKSSDESYQAIARLRLAGLLLEKKAYDEALQQVSGAFPKAFTALAADRRGDIFSAQGKKAEARAEYEKAYKELDERTEYRRLVEVKLNALGVDPAASQIRNRSIESRGEEMIYQSFRPLAQAVRAFRARYCFDSDLGRSRRMFLFWWRPRQTPAGRTPAGEALVSARQVWSSRVGQVNFPLETGVSGTSVAVASGDGTVALLDTQTGRDFWRLALNTSLAAGAGNDGKVVAVVSKANEVIALQDGRNCGARSWAPRPSPRLSWPAGCFCAGGRSFGQRL
jgi:tetratricopeptide (TPR) repeat protein